MLVGIKYQEIKLLSGSDKLIMLFFLLINVKMPTTVGILTFMSRELFMLSCVEHEKSFITPGPELRNNFHLYHPNLMTFWYETKYANSRPYRIFFVTYETEFVLFF